MNCSFLILIVKTTEDGINIPDNMIILNEYNSTIKKILSVLE